MMLRKEKAMSPKKMANEPEAEYKEIPCFVARPEEDGCYYKIFYRPANEVISESEVDSQELFKAV